MKKSISHNLFYSEPLPWFRGQLETHHLQVTRTILICLFFEILLGTEHFFVNRLFISILHMQSKM